MKQLILYVCLLTINLSNGQVNLIADSSFEVFNYLPVSFVRDPYLFNKILPYWYSPTNGTPDYFNILNKDPEVGLPFNSRDISSTPIPLCTNYQMPRTGNGCAGFGGLRLINTESRSTNEYLQTKLINMLIENHYYSISFYINRNHCSFLTYGNIGAYISTDSIRKFYPNSNDYTNFSNFEYYYKPQVKSSSIIEDTSNWTQIKGIYKAKGGEKWITIGHFRVPGEDFLFYDTFDNIYSFAYFFIDDVGVYEKKSVIYPDTVCKGEKISLSSTYKGPFKWHKNGVLVSKNSSLDLFAIQSAEYVLISGESIDTFQIFVKEDAYFNLGKDTLICLGDSIHLMAPGPSNQILWQDLRLGAERTVLKGGLYHAIRNVAGCEYSDSILIIEYNKPSGVQVESRILCNMDSVGSMIRLNSHFSYRWSADGDTSRCKYLKKKGSWSLRLFENHGCYIDTNINVSDFCNPNVWVPSACAPYGVNKTFNPIITELSTASLSIFNRWGEKLFETSGKSVQWDCMYKDQFCPAGLYVYILDYTAYDGRRYMKQGTFALIE